MPEIRVYDPGWKDRRWYKGLKKLGEDRQKHLLRAVRELVEDLVACSHPTLDPRLQRWSPTKYHVPGRQKKQGAWYEYRLGDRKNAARVIICHDAVAQVIYLVARTVVHDHGRLERIVRDF